MPRLLDVRWLLYRQACRWQLGESDGRWVAVASLVTAEVGWLTAGLGLAGCLGGLEVLAVFQVGYWWVAAAMYAFNWFVVVPSSGLAPFEERAGRWPSWARTLELPAAIFLAAGWIGVLLLRPWAWLS